MLHRFLAEEGVRRDDPTADIEGVRVPAGIPHPLSEDEVGALLAAPAVNEPVGLRDRALLEFLYATGARIREACGLSLGDFDHEEQLVRLFGKGSKERIVPFGRHAAAALAEWLGPSGRPHLEPLRWARRGDAEAVFLNQRGARLSRQAAWAMVKKYGDRVGLGRQAVAARAAALVRDPSARSRRRSAHRAGAARPRVDLDDPGVHEGQPGAAVRCVPIGASAGAAVDEPVARRPSRPTVRRLAVASRAASPRTTAWVDSQLLDGESQLWQRMSARRPSPLDRGRPPLRVERLRWTRDEMAGALLHDVGKLDSGPRHGRRVVATIVGPRTRRFRRYHDHERIGADMLARGRVRPTITVDLVPSATDSRGIGARRRRRHLATPSDAGQRGKEADGVVAPARAWPQRRRRALSAPLRSSEASSPRSVISSW